MTEWDRETLLAFRREMFANKVDRHAARFRALRRGLAGIPAQVPSHPPMLGRCDEESPGRWVARIDGMWEGKPRFDYPLLHRASRLEAARAVDRYIAYHESPLRCCGHTMAFFTVERQLARNGRVECKRCGEVLR